jgi:hypothetical protein
MTNETVNVTAVMMEDRKVVLDDGTVLDMVELHDEEGEVEDIDDAVFATVQLPNGKWFCVHFADFEFPGYLN